MAMVGVAVLAAAPLAVGGADKSNEVFEHLTSEGVAVGGGHRVKLPAPSMADGLDARAQQAVLEAVAGSEHSPEELLRKSLVAPFVLKFRDAGSADPEAPAFGLDVWFVAHGDFASLDRRTMLALEGNHKQAWARVLSAEELARRKLADRSGEGRHERYSHAVLTLFDRVQVNLTLHALTTRRADSLLAAARVDPRFAADTDFPNQWRRLACDDDGRPKAGPAQAWSGGGAFLKITKLLKPEGAVFVEFHLVLTEPRAWFDGANLLRSKVPLVARSEIRSFRRELANGKK
jgi:hypothetical protein